VDEPGGDLGEGSQHEAPLVQSGVGDDEPGHIANLLAEEEDVHVDRPRAVPLRAHPPHLTLGGEARLEERLGPDLSAWRWGDLHHVVFAGPLAAFPGLGEIFAAGIVGRGGDDDTLDQGAFEPERRYDAVVIASWRQIQDLSDPDASTGTHTTGQSGHPGSPAWRDLIPLWSAGERHPLPLSREAVERVSATSTTLVPR